ncbi:MAG: hypothetical protein F6J95_005355 [Leptolyngbya sp. SIO1E4]|nr:hypothetical protein [Leptolyngbya sp. SIO1E4]
MNIRWRSAFRYPQTIFLLIGAALGYLAMAVFTRASVVGLGVGALITLGMLIAWFLQFQRDRITTTGNLLNRTVMLEHLDAIARRLAGVETLSVWADAYQWASASQTAAAEIAQREPTLVPDLVETLYTVEALVSDVGGSAIALEQVQTEQYRTLTQRQLTQSCDRLRATHDQLQQLRDQIVLSQLKADAAASAALPARLQLLIDANKTTLKAATDDRPSP